MATGSRLHSLLVCTASVLYCSPVAFAQLATDGASPFDGFPEKIQLYDPAQRDGDPNPLFVSSVAHFLLGPGKITDAKSRRPFEFFNGSYYSRRADQAALGSLGAVINARFGKADDSFERHDTIALGQNDVRVNERRGSVSMTAASLHNFTGSANFEAYANVSIDEAKQNRKKSFRISFIAADLVARDLIDSLNRSPNALQFIRDAAADGITPAVVTANVIMLDTKMTDVLDADLQGTAKTIVETGHRVTVKASRDSNETITLESPIIRGYQMSDIVFDEVGDEIVVKRLRSHWD